MQIWKGENTQTDEVFLMSLLHRFKSVFLGHNLTSATAETQTDCRPVK